MSQQEPPLATKKCPYCAEEIQAEAIKCKHCGELLRAEHRPKAKPLLVSGIGFKRSESDKKIIKWTAIGFGVLILILVPSLILPTLAGLGAWMVYKRPALRMKLLNQVKKARTTLWPYIKLYKLPISIVAGLFVAWMGVSASFAVAAPQLTLPAEYTFSGKEVTVAGQVKADCRCDTEVTVNDKQVELQNDGSFTIAIPVTADINTGSISVEARTTGGLFSKKTVEVAEEKNFRREASTVEFVGPYEWGTSTITLSLRGVAGSSVSVKGKNEVVVLLDETGEGTAQLSFDTTYNVETNSYTLTTRTKGFSDGTSEIKVKNLKLDPERLAKEKAAEEKRLADIREQEQRRERMRQNPLEFIEMVNNSWYMGGFGSIPIHSITLKNTGEVAYKDIGIAVTYSSNSDTLVDVAAHVILDILPAGKTKTFREINMGFMDGQAAKSRVEILSAKIYNN